MKKLILMALAVAVAFTACDNGNGDDGQEHSGTISAWSRTITVKGDASISTANFNTAKGKLEDAMVTLDEGVTGESRIKYTNMLDRAGFAIIIETGNASPNANTNKQMTVGISYVLNTSANALPENDEAYDDVNVSIAWSIRGIVIDDAFAD